MPETVHHGGVSTRLTERTNSRQALVDAAFEEFTSKGYEAATLVGIAERAGVTTGAVYAHFGGKLDLLLACVGLTPIADLAGSLKGFTPTSRSLGRSLAARPDRSRVLLLDVIVLARRDPEVAETLRNGLEAYVRFTARTFDADGGGDAISRLLAVINLGMIVFAALDARTPPAGTFERVVESLLPPRPHGSGALARVRSSAAAMARGEDKLHDSIAAAVADGHSLRAVGSAAGLSHEAVRRIASAAR
jgi:AcrR family transcriptional regulator